MRFNQLKRDPNSIVRKKLYKKGKCWVVASSLAFASGLILLGTSGMSVQADVTSDNAAQKNVAVVQGDSSTTSQDGTGGSEDVGDGNPSIEDGNSNGTVAKDSNGGTEQSPTTNVQSEVQPTKGIDNESQNKTLNETASLNDVGDATDSQTETTPKTTSKAMFPNYNPNAGFDNNAKNSPMSGTQFTIPDNQIPDQIKQEGIYQSGMDGTSPYFITNDTHTLYFLDGTLDKRYTAELLSNDDLMLNHISKVDTSLANKVYFPADSSDFFNRDLESGNITTLEMNLSKADTSHVANMSNMFNDGPIPALDLRSFDTSNVQNMSGMFNGLGNYDGQYLGEPCALDVSSFKGSKLTNVSSMFASAYVKNINMPYFTLANATNATNASSMFNSANIDKILIPNFDGSKISVLNIDGDIVDYWDHMFAGATITNLDISTWNMIGNTQFCSLFEDPTTIKEITLGPKNKFDQGESLPAGSNGEKVSWISIGKNGIVDDPALTFFAIPEGPLGEYYGGLGKYYDGTGKTGVKSFVPDTDIQTRSLNVPTTMDGKKLDDTVYSNLLVKTGIPVTLDVPAKAGYTSDKKTINATVTDDGITTDETINYVKIPASSGTTQNVFVSNKVQTITTNPDEGNVTLYRQEGQNFVPITDRVLTADSGWYTDQIANVGGENSDVQYYRIATNEWVKASQAYVYHANKTIIRTNSGAAKQLMHAEGTNVSDRALSPDTEWYSDITADLGEGEYYRVATNEFINKNDVTVIKNV